MLKIAYNMHDFSQQLQYFPNWTSLWHWRNYFCQNL